MASDDSVASAPVPYDLLVVAALALLTVVVSLTPALSSSPLSLLVAVVALFSPGYALIAALFPRRRLRSNEVPGSLAARVAQVDAFDRAVLAIAAGLVVTPLLGIALDFSPFALRRDPVLVTVSGFTVLTATVAAARRRRLPPSEQYNPAARWVSAWDDFDRGSGLDVVTVVVAAAVLVALGGVFVTASTGQTGERFTEFYVLGEEDGEASTTTYPNATVVDTPITVRLGIENHEGETVTYTVVTRLQRVDQGRIVEQRRFEDVRLTVDASETALRPRTVRPQLTGPNLRLTYLLYRGDPPSNPTTDNAYRWTHLWVNVTER